MQQFDIALNIRDLAGNLVLALEDEANGFWVRAGGMPAYERRPISQESRSPFVDGASDDRVTYDRTEGSILLKVFGPTWADVQRRLIALREATTATAWVLEDIAEGVRTTRRCGPVTILEPPVTPMDRFNKRVFVVLTFPVQPGVTITGV